MGNDRRGPGYRPRNLYSVIINKLRDVIPPCLHLSIFKMDMLIFVLPTPLLYGWGSSYQMDSLQMPILSSGQKPKTKTTTIKLSEATGEWAKAGRYLRGVNTWKKHTTLSFCYLWLLVQGQVLVCTTGAAKTQKATVLLAWRNRRQNPGPPQLLEYEGEIPGRRQPERRSLKFCV